MADLIELDVVVRDKTIKQSISTVSRLERELTKAAKAIEESRISQDRYNKILLSAKREYQALGLSSQKATASVRKFVTEQRDLARTTDVVQNEMRQATSAVNNHTRSLRNSASSANEVRNQYVRMNAATFKAQQGAKRFASVGLQQAGYQVGDFIVQVQNGQSALVAFGQQGSQLAGIFGPAGAIIGAFIAAGTALGMIFKAFNEAGQGAKDLTESLQSLGDAASSLEQALETHEQSLVDLVDKYGVLAVQIRETQVAMAEAAAQKAFLDIRETATLTTGSIDRLTKATQNLRLAQEGAFDQLPNILQTAQDPLQRAEMIVEGLAKELGLSAENAVGLGDALKDIQEADSLQEQSRAAAEVVRILDLIPISVKEQNQELFTAIEQMAQVAEQGAIAARATEKLNGSAPSSSWMDSAVTGVNNLYNRIITAINGVETLKNGIEPSGVAGGRSGGRGGPTAEEIQRNVPSAQLAYATTIDPATGTSGGSSGGGVSEIEQLQQAYETLRASVDETFASQQKFNEAQDTLNKALEAGIISGKEYEKVLELVRKEYGQIGKGAKSLSDIAGEAFAEAYVTTEEYNELLKNELVQGIESVSGAFTDFIMGGMRNFSDFADAVKATFRNLIATLIQTAVQNQIVIPIATQLIGGGGGASSLLGGGGGSGGIPTGAGSITSVAGGLNAALTAGGSLVGVSGLAGGFGAGLGMAGSAFAGGGISGLTGTIGAQIGAATTAGASLASVGAAIGAVAAPLLAVAAVFSFFKKRTKELDSGLRITAETLDATVESFRVIQTKRFFGLSKKVRTNVEVLDEEAAGPIVEGIVSIQKSIMDAAELLGIAGSAFDNFMYDMEISLKGLTEDQKVQKITEELNKMGDSFASLTGHFETMNELLEVANQRYEIQNQVRQLLGRNEELLSRQRQAQLEATHELNRPAMQSVFNLQDAQAAVQNAFAALRRSIDETVNDLRDKLNIANNSLQESRRIFNLIARFVDRRQIQGAGLSDSIFQRSRESSLNFLRSGDLSDERELQNALQVVSEPTEGLFGSFVDYARDFMDTTRVIKDLERTAGVQLSADEQAVQKLEDQIAQAEQQYQTQVDQYNALVGIENGVLSIPEAITNLAGAISQFQQAQQEAITESNIESASNLSGDALKEALGGETLPNGIFRKQFETASDVLDAARLAGVSTEGKKGYEIIREISPKLGGGSVIGPANSEIAYRQFAQGGFHTGGMRIVGEQGPELEMTGPSRIFSNRQTSEMFRDPELTNEVRNLRSEVAGLRSENAQLQANNNKYTKRSYDLYRKWDIEGIPAERT